MGDPINKNKTIQEEKHCCQSIRFEATGQLVKRIYIFAGAVISCFGPALLDRLSFHGKRTDS